MSTLESVLLQYFRETEKFMQFKEGDIAPLARVYEVNRLAVYLALEEEAPEGATGTPTEWNDSRRAGL